KLRARATDPALDRSDRAAADFGRLLIGKTRCPDEDDRLALVFRQLLQRRAEILEVELAMLGGMNGETRGHDAVAVLDLAAALAHLRIELVAQDGEQPGLEIGA